MTIVRRAVASALLMLLVAGDSFAWGPDGHRAVARLAEARLTDTARAAIRALLGTESLADVAIWADEVRNTTHPATYNWHFTDVPVNARRFNRTRDCKANPEKGDCSIAALERLSAIVGDATKSELERREALKFIVHIVGDIHQPLHSAERAHDQGGNLVTVTLLGQMMNLHAAWDRGIIGAFQDNEKTLVEHAEQWLESQQERRVARGSFVDWTNEGHDIARDIVYKHADDRVIDAHERAEAIRIIRKRIGRAGVRLATVLNRAFQ
jgi:nuclease S1